MTTLATMTASLDGAFNTAPDTPSPVYPDRLIRPLPKRTLRSRLSLEAAGSILYPPAPRVTQLFYSPVPAVNGEVVNDSKVYVQQALDDDDEDDADEQGSDRDHHHPYENGVEYDSEDEDKPVVVRRSAGFRGASLPPSGSGAQQPSQQIQGQRNSFDAGGGGAASAQTKSPSIGPDGYDAFENTNNKKKRKIPTPGNLSHHSSLSPEFATMGLSLSSSKPPAGENESSSTTGTYYGTGNPASPVSSGISGPGRGRLGRNPARHNSVRNPLSVHTANTYLNTRSSGRRDVPSLGATGDSLSKSDPGIISTAIANAAASTSATPKGSSNVSLLDQKTTSPSKTQFTFTCESDSSKDMALQSRHSFPISQQHPPAAPALPPADHHRGFATPGTQTGPSMMHGNPHAQSAAQHLPMPQPGQAPDAAVAGGKKKKKRSPGSIYALAARQRKLQQQYTNIHHPPNPEDIWICEFCEYESIFGHPPEALIRQYEIKDRKERKRLAEKRRLLEKAKMKGRKGKKPPKNATKHTTSPQVGHHQHEYDRGPADYPSSGGAHDLHDDEDEYIEHEYDDDEEPVSVTAAAAAAASPAAAAATFKTPPLPASQAILADSVLPTRGVTDGGTRRPV